MCGGRSRSLRGAATAPRPDSSPASRAGGTLTVLWVGDAAQIDCGGSCCLMDWMLCASAQRALYGYRRESGNDMVPDLAVSSPQVSTDRRKVTVRSGPVCASRRRSTRVTSRDVKYAIERGFFKTLVNGYAGGYSVRSPAAGRGGAPSAEIPGLETPDDRAACSVSPGQTAGCTPRAPSRFRSPRRCRVSTLASSTPATRRHTARTRWPRGHT